MGSNPAIPTNFDAESATTVQRERPGESNRPAVLVCDESATLGMTAGPTETAAPATEQTWANFLERTPPNTRQRITDLFELVPRTPGEPEHYRLLLPDVQLHCDSEACQGIRFFAHRGEVIKWNVGYPPEHTRSLFFAFGCRNCSQRWKTFAVLVQREKDSVSGYATKYGELPAFGPRVPSRVISVLRDDRDLFIKGRRCENQGLGIGAFAYYRRVVENQKGRLIEEVGKVASKLGAGPEVLKRFAAAAKTTSFEGAIDAVKDVMPDALKVEGHNPLTILHSALSKGLHADSDEECLDAAEAIRIVLTEMADRMTHILQEQTELKAAIARLMTPQLTERDKNK